jgi:hypothetical protein
VFGHAFGTRHDPDESIGALEVDWAVSRAFVKEDSSAPEVKLGAYRLYVGHSRYDFHPAPVDSSDDLVLMLRSVKNRQGYTQLRDATGTLLLEVL